MEEAEAEIKRLEGVIKLILKQQAEHEAWHMGRFDNNFWKPEEKK